MKNLTINILRLSILFLIVAPVFIYAQSPIQEIVYEWNTNTDPITFLGNDALLKTSWLPNDNTGGLPYEVLYCADVNKYYVYTSRNIIVMDGTTTNIIKRIDICDRGTFTLEYDAVVNLTNRYNEQKMAYNPSLQCIYCATEDEKLKVIDCNTDVVTTTFAQNEVIENFMIDVYYNSSTNRLYWLVSGYDNKAVIKTIDGTNNTLIDERVLPEMTVYKITGDQSGERLFLSTEKHGVAPGKLILVLNAATLDDITALSVNNVFVNLMHNNNNNKLYLSPYQETFIGVINCIPGGYSYLYNITVPNDVKQLTYNPGNNRIYSCGGGSGGKINIINGNDDLLITSLSINTPNSLIYSSAYNSVFCGGYNKLVKITGSSNSINSQCSSNYGGRSYGLALNNTASKIASVNMDAGHVTFFDVNQPDPNIILDGYKQVGGGTYYGCLNTTNKKYYFIQNDSKNTKSFVNIYDATNNQLLNTLLIDGASELKTCTYDEMSNKIYITSKGNSKVYVISGTNDFQLSATISNISQPVKIASVPNTGKVICGGLNNIYVINTANNTILATISNPNEAIVSDFVFSDLYPDKVYASCFYSGKVIKIDLLNYVIENTLNVSAGLTDFAYNNESYVLYAVKNGASSVYIINESTFTISSTLNVKPYSSELVYNPLTKSVYLLSSGGTGVIGGITVIKGSTIAKVIDIVGVHSPGMIMNPINNMLYFHSFFNPYSIEKESYLTAYDCTDDVVKSTLYLGQKQNYGEGSAYWNVDEGMVFNPDNNQLIIGNRGFSNLSVIQCATDVLGLNFGWRWISFPRMERYAFNDEPVSPVPIMKNASFYDDFYFTLWAQPQGSNPIFKRFNPNMPDPWSGILIEVYSTLGYKYEAPPSDQTTPPQQKQTLTGARLYPECPVGLPGSGGEKWIGYFIEESQYPWDAFPSAIYNGPGGLTRIQAQYWTMDKITNGGGGWGWIKSGKVTPIKYGDMVIIRYTGLETSFIWNNPNASEEDKIIPQPQAYSWEEKADYIPFYVETDSTSNIAEIAVKVNGECMGATVRQQGDTLIEVDGYLGELPVGAVVEFETWNGLKSTQVERNGYVVYDPTMQKKEKRNIYVGERQDFYMVSFKAGEVFEIPDDISQVTCGPNPFRDETILTMRLNNEQHIAVEVYNIQGARIKTLLNSDLPGGYYEVIWNGDNENGTKVKEGVYFYKIKAGNGTIVTDKIILIK